MPLAPNPFRPPSVPVEGPSHSRPVEPKFIKRLVRVALTSTLFIPLLFVLVFVVSYDVAEIVFIAMIATSIISLVSSLAALITSLCFKQKKHLLEAILLMVLFGLIWAIAYPALLGGRQ
jgi:hypothetical protein